NKLLGDLAVAVKAMGLVDRAFVVVEPEPLHRLQDRVDRGLGAALAVGVLDAQDELAAAATRLQPAVQRGARAADVQVTGGAGGEAGAAGHAIVLGTGEPPILAGRPGARARHPYNAAMTTLFISDLHLDARSEEHTSELQSREN